MRIERVQLTRIKSYDEQTVRFAAGANCICGPNGAGKTTLVEAIGWAVFDSLPYTQAKFVRDGHPWGQVMVALVARDGREYQVVRRAGSGSGWYVHDPEVGVRLAEGSADVREWLRRYLGIEENTEPKALFENAIGVPQGGLAAPFLLAPDRRKQVFDPILRVNEYRDASEKLRETASHLQQRARDQQALADRQGVEADKLPALREALAATGARIEDTERLQRARRAEQARQTSAVAALEAEERRIGALRTAVELSRRGLEQTTATRDRARLRVDQAWRAHESVERSIKGHNLCLAAQRELRDLDPLHRRYLETAAALDAARRETERADAELRTASRRLSEAEAAAVRVPELERAAKEEADLLRRAQELRLLAGRLPALRARARDAARQLEEVERERRRLAAELEAAERCRPEADRLDSLREERERLVLAGQAARQAQDRLAELEPQRSEILSRLAKSESVVAGLLEKARVAPETERLAGRVEELAEEERRAQGELNALSVELERVRAHKEARVVACPLSRDDCLAIQRDPERDHSLLRELARAEEAQRAALQRHSRTEAHLRSARAAATIVQAALVSRASLDPERRAAKALAADRDRLAAQIERAHSESADLQRLRRECEELNARIKAAERAAAMLGRLPDLLGARDQQERRREELDRARADTEAEVAEAEAATSELGEVEPRLAEHKGAGDALATGRALAAALPEAGAEREARAARVEEAGRDASRLQEELTALGDVERRRAEAQASLDAHRPAHEEYLSNVVVAEELTARQKELKGFESEADAQARDLEAREGELREAEETWSPDALAGARARREQLSSELGALAATERDLRVRAREHEESLRACEEQARLREAALREAERLRGALELLSFARETIKAAQGPITEALLYSVSQEARNLFMEIIDDHSVRLEWTPDYEVQLERGSERLIFNQLSGGEQMSAALAVRLAMLKKLSDIDVAFLDEPTQNMDETRRTNLAAQVAGLRGFEQLFVISHDDTFERQASHAVVVRKADGESVVSYGHEEV